MAAWLFLLWILADFRENGPEFLTAEAIKRDPRLHSSKHVLRFDGVSGVRQWGGAASCAPGT